MNGGVQGNPLGCSSHSSRDALAWLGCGSTGLQLLLSNARTLPRAQPCHIQRLCLEEAEKEPLPALPLCLPAATEHEHHPVSQGVSIPTPCVSLSLGPTPASSADSNAATILNTWVLCSPGKRNYVSWLLGCALVRQQDPAWVQQEKSARGQSELAAVHCRVFGKYECVKYAVLHRTISHGNKLIWVKNDKF